MSNELVAHEERHMKTMPELSMEIIKKFICPSATDQEAYAFLQLCKAQRLNPFLKEVYLIKYGTSAASIVTGKDTFLKRAERLLEYDGFKAGIILLSNGQVIYREGAFMVNGEQLLGGWAEVYRKDRSVPIRAEVTLKEYERRKGDGSLMRPWAEMPATMIRKVPIVQAHREAFPDEFGGLYAAEEMPIDTSALPSYEVGKHPDIPPPSQQSKPPITQPQSKSSQQTPQGDSTTRATLKQELSNFCKGSVKEMETLLAELSGFGEGENRKEIKHLADIDNPKISDKWLGKTLGNLREKIKKQLPSSCTKNPNSCEISVYMKQGDSEELVALCEGKPCQFQTK